MAIRDVEISPVRLPQHVFNVFARWHQRVNKWGVWEDRVD